MRSMKKITVFLILIAVIGLLLAGGLLLSQRREDRWRLMLVNQDHPVPENYSVSLYVLGNGESVDARIYPYLQEMVDAARATGLTLSVWEGYRSHQEQMEMMEQYIQDYIEAGHTREEAETMARDWVAEPGTSEHELGLAVDINADKEEDSQAVYDFLAEHAWEYGFILRYPPEKEDVTGISYEPWHYRYVGKTAAKAIHEKGITLEEYLEHR